MRFSIATLSLAALTVV
ncbi:hypothetical protein MG9_05871, partial [Candida albicans P37037]